MDILIHGASDLALPIALGFTVFAIVALAFGALLGALRGVHRSFLRVGLMILSGVAAFFVALPSKNIYISNLHKLVMEMDIPWITASPDVESILEGYVLVFAAPLIFLAAFIAFNLIGYIIYLILAFTIFPRRKYHPKDGSEGMPRHRLFGTLVGVLAGVILVACVNLPFYGFTHFVQDELGDAVEEIDEVVEFEPAFNLSNTINSFTFGKTLFHSLTEVDVNDHHVSLQKDGKLLAADAIHVLHVFEVPMNEWGDSEKQTVASVFEDAKNNEPLAALISGEAKILHGMLVEDGEIKGVKVSDDLKPIIIELLEALSTNSDSYNEVLDTSKELVLMLVDGMQRNNTDTLSLKLIVEDKELLGGFLKTVLTARSMDGVTVSAVNFGLQFMAKELKMNGKFKVDEEAWRASDDAARIAEAELVAGMFSNIIKFTEDENGQSKVSVTGGAELLKLKKSQLVGPVASKVVVSLATNLLQAFKDNKTEAPNPGTSDNPGASDNPGIPIT